MINNNMPGLILAIILVGISVIMLTLLFRKGFHRRMPAESSGVASSKSRLATLGLITIMVVILCTFLYLGAALVGSATPILVIIFFFVVSVGIFFIITNALEAPSGKSGKFMFFFAYWLMAFSLFYIFDTSFSWGILSPPIAPIDAIDYSPQPNSYDQLLPTKY